MTKIDTRFLPCDKCGWSGKVNKQTADRSIAKYGQILCWDCMPLEDKLKVLNYDTASTKSGLGKTVD